MSETISLTVPIRYNELTRASEMLARLAEDIIDPSYSAELAGALETLRKPVTAADLQIFKDDVIRALLETLGGAVNIDLTTTGHVEETAEDETVHHTAIDKSEQVQTSTDNTVAPGPDGALNINDAEMSEIVKSVAAPPVALDSDGLPWDVRIHAGSKVKLVRTNQWKKKRGVTGATVDTVEAELRAALAASPDRPVTEETDAATAFGDAVVAGPDDAVVAGPDDKAAPGPDDAVVAGPTDTTVDTAAITTFAQLNAAITGAGIDPATVDAAVKKVGLAAYPLLGVREDLILNMVAELFPAAGA